MTVRKALGDAAQQLAAVSDTPRLDAELLMAHALGVERAALLLRGDVDYVPSAFTALIERRLAYEPVAYIIGHQDFWTIRLAVAPGVLIPRSDSETLIEAALDHFGATGPATILDLGTGPGTLLLAALDQWPDARGMGVDTAPEAIAQAQANACSLGLASRACFAIGGWSGHPPADLILCNPPYIAAGEILMPDVADYEPPAALFAGKDGLDDYCAIIPRLRAQLHDGGIAVLEIGSTQRAAVTKLAAAQGFEVSCRRDLGGRDRALVLV